MTRWSRSILIAVTVLALLVPAMVAITVDINLILAVTLTDQQRLGVLVALFVGIGLLVAFLAWHGPDGGYGATLQGTALWLPWSAALVSSALYLATNPVGEVATQNATFSPGQRGAASLLIGSGLAGALWLLYALVDHEYPTARRQSPGWYGLLKGSLAGLRLRAAEPSPPCADANAATIRDEIKKQLDKIDQDVDKPGLQWVTRAGFNVVWTDYHNADAALIDVVGTGTLIDIGISDLLRLDGAAIKGRVALQNDLQAALTAIDPKVESYVSALVPKDAKDEKACADAMASTTAVMKKAEQPITVPSAGYLKGVKQCLLALIGRASGSPTKPTTNEKPKVESNDCAAERRSRTIIQTIHRSLNTYRGTRWSELGRARWQLILTTTVAGVVAFLLLALGLIRGVRAEQLMTGWAYFLIGAVAGLFLRLYLASLESQVSDDYGLDAARVYQTPLLSGMAAVIGVVLMASVAGSTLAEVLTPETEPNATTAAVASAEASAGASASPAASPTPTPMPSGGAIASASERPTSTQPTTATLASAFDLGAYPVGLVLALAFGLTPSLVLRRLGVSASKAKDELLATRPT
jgi:hypothetical protein